MFKYLTGLAVLLAFAPEALAQIDTPCTYQEYVCGQTLIDNGYAVPDLRTAYDLNLAAPVIEDTSLNQVLFRCVDTAGTIIGNSYCIVDCAVVGTDTTNDMCTM